MCTTISRQGKRRDKERGGQAKAHVIYKVRNCTRKPAALFYCQQYYGIGHVVRTLTIANGLAEHSWSVTVAIASHLRVGFLKRPNLKVYPLPALLLSPSEQSARTKIGENPRREFFQARPRWLGELLAELRPRLFVTEHFPFERRHLHYELDP